MNKNLKNYPGFADDMRALDNLANAYSTCESDFRNVWKQKWYEMISVIANKTKRWRDTKKTQLN